MLALLLNNREPSEPVLWRGVVELCLSHSVPELCVATFNVLLTDLEARL